MHPHTLQLVAEAAAKLLANIKLNSKNDAAWLTSTEQNQVSQLIADLGAEGAWRQLDANHLPTFALPMLLVLAPADNINPSDDPLAETIYSLHDHQNNDGGNAAWIGKSYPSLQSVALSLSDLTQLNISHVLIISKPALADGRGNYLAPAAVKHWFWRKVGGIKPYCFLAPYFQSQLTY